MKPIPAKAGNYCFIPVHVAGMNERNYGFLEKESEMKKVILFMMVLACVLWAADQAQATLLGHWKLDDNDAQTQVDDSSTAGNHGTATGATSGLHIAGQVGTGAFAFNGTNDRVDAGSNYTITNDFTIMAWMKTTEGSAGYFFIRGIPADPWTCYTLGVVGGKLWSRDNDGTTQGDAKSTADVNDGNWHHVAVVADANQPLTLYIDGSALAADAYDTRQNAPAGPYAIPAANHLFIGGRSNTSFPGSVDDVGFWDEALSASMISYCYQNGIPEPATVLLLGIGGLALMLRRRRAH